MKPHLRLVCCLAGLLIVGGGVGCPYLREAFKVVNEQYDAVGNWRELQSARRRSDELDARRERIRHWQEGKREAVRAVIAGRMTLLEAAARSRELDRQRAARLSDPVFTVESGAARQDDRYRGERHDVVHHGRHAEEAFDGGQWRAHAHLAAASLETLEHRGLLAADIGAGAEPHLELERASAAAYVGAQATGAARRCDRLGRPR